MKRAADMDFALSPPADSPSPSSHSSELSGPPRKRARSELTPEERREARAHRNRIAAQNSRDRRKAQFAYLERRVAELEEENRQLRSGMGLTAPRQPPQEQKDEEREKDLARERENEELRQRVKTLEAGWEAVMKALAASGLPLNLPSVPPSSTSSVPSSNAIAPATTGGDHRCPSFIIGVPAAGGSECPSNHLQLELNIPPPSSYPPVINLGESASAPADEVAMDDLLREFLAPSPVSPQAPLPASSAPTIAHSPARSRSQSVSEIKLSPAPVSTAPVNPTLPEIDWESEVEMQRLLAMLPVAQQSAAPTDASAVSGDFPSALDLDLCAWDMAGVLNAPAGSSSVSVF
ncbi:hypothetical protein PYCCODRAFT_1474360 [Trametes coccinea BRFM310]|uniref:X-box-binding protein 1 n=1 Tax=Trametes coccinea (strain BRFM310) TaxID=1353009 RepID=A0A1Y2J2E0_TRAC3|nr:hypothetical protein PYCCODRAFT_1474360 [Trametes coccinea BRFM310]